MTPQHDLGSLHSSPARNPDLENQQKKIVVRIIEKKRGSDSDAKSTLASFTTNSTAARRCRARKAGVFFVEDGQGQNQYMKEVSIMLFLNF